MNIDKNAPLHEPEPWKAGDDQRLAAAILRFTIEDSVDCHPVLGGPRDRLLAVFFDSFDRRRALACVNGCKDIEHPAAIPEAVKALERTLDYVDLPEVRAALARLKGTA